jgi:nitrite reductase/ring-hydroxylating ferredoxin subunit
VITCPGHAYDFDLRTGRCAHDRDLELRRYPITLVGDEIWVDLV